jgi:3-oxoacid CoA-transferase subunit B
MSWTSKEMCQEVIALFKDGASVNLGIGMPTEIAEHISPKKNIWIHSENGVLGVEGRPTKNTVSSTLINAGKETVSIKKGASFFDSSLSFGMIRGGHVDYCVLGGMEVDCEGSLANWMVPGKKLTGMGGAMDLVNGAKEVFVMMNHFSKDGAVKLVPKCTLPLTGFQVVNLIFTELGIFKPENNTFKVIKLASNVKDSDLKLHAFHF